VPKISLNLSSGVRELPNEGWNLVNVEKSEFRTGRGATKETTTLYTESIVVGSDNIKLFNEQAMGDESAFYIAAMLEAFGYDFPEDDEERKIALANVEIDDREFSGKQVCAKVEITEYAGKPRANIVAWARPGTVDIVNNAVAA